MSRHRRYSQKRGGSLASDPYDKRPSQAPPNMPYPGTPAASISGDDIVKNYGSVYKTTGGGDLGKKAYDFTSKFIDNRVLDLYLKYLGITTLTPTTLVPIALIYGQKAFMEAVSHMKKQEQKGGTIPVIDNSLVGNYLKIAGLTQLSLSLNTIVPLGLAMAIYQAAVSRPKEEQKGGHIAKLITGTNSPAGYLQLGHMNWEGQTIANNIYRPLTGWEQLSRKNVYRNHELQVPCAGNSCGVDPANSNPPLDKLYVTVPNLNPVPGQEDSGPVLAIRPTEDSSASSKIYDPTSQDTSVDISADPNYSAVLPNQMAGSDWKSSQYSRGAYNAPNMSQQQFQAFAKNGQYVSNQELASGAGDAFQPASALRAARVGPPSSYPSYGVAASDFSAGGKRRGRRRR